MSSPELPADEPLQRRVALVHEGPTPGPAEPERLLEGRWLPVVEYVAFPVVRRGTAWRLISELRASFYRQRLVRVYERFTDRELAGGAGF